MSKLSSLPKHEIKQVKKGWVILRPDGDIDNKHDWINECAFKERKYAEKHLEMLIAMGWAR